MTDPTTSEVFAEIASIWLPYLGEDGDRLVCRCWTSDGVGRLSDLELYDAEGRRQADRPAFDESGERTAFSRMQSRLHRLTSARLGELHRRAVDAGLTPPPNWFELTLWRDGRHEASFTYDAAQQARYAPSSPVDRRVGTPQGSERPSVSEAGSDASVDEARNLARTNFDNVFRYPDDAAWVERFLHAQARVGVDRPWVALRVALRSGDGRTRVSQHVRWEGKEELEPLPVAEPLWLIDVLEHLRARHGGTAENRGDLVVDVGEEDMRIRLDEPK